MYQHITDRPKSLVCKINNILIHFLGSVIIYTIQVVIILDKIFWDFLVPHPVEMLNSCILYKAPYFIDSGPLCMDMQIHKWE
jgi:hypothetical protein